MPTLATEHDLQRARRRIDHCYLCGKPLNDGRLTNRDHAPPRALFLDADRASPLILPTHVVCNGARSDRDEIVGQLVQGLHGRIPDPPKDRRGLVPVQDSDGKRFGILPSTHLSLHHEIDRWQKACHATLYGTPLPQHGVDRNIHPPMPPGRRVGSEFVLDPILPQQRGFVEIIRANRITNTLDRIEAWSGKFVYECTWVRADHGPWWCVWAMRVYNWETLASFYTEERWGCTGFYQPPDGKPKSAVEGTRIQLPTPILHPLDPFAA